MTPAHEVLDATDAYDIGIYGIAEPNAVMACHLKNAINVQRKKRFDGNGFIAAPSGPGRKSGYNPGDILQLIRGQASGRHSKSGANKWGRFSWMTLRGKNSKKLCIITAYRVCQTKGTTPASRYSTTAHWQQVKAMIKQGCRDPDPRT